jgi:hypothetical protein
MRQIPPEQKGGFFQSWQSPCREDHEPIPEPESCSGRLNDKKIQEITEPYHWVSSFLDSINLGYLRLPVKGHYSFLPEDCL